MDKEQGAPTFIGKGQHRVDIENVDIPGVRIMGNDSQDKAVLQVVAGCVCTVSEPVLFPRFLQCPTETQT